MRPVKHIHLALTSHLGKEFVVWDKYPEIDFLSPGKGTMTAFFEIDHQTIEQLREKAQDNQKHLPVFHTSVIDEDGKVVATVKKILYVRKKIQK